MATKKPKKKSLQIRIDENLKKRAEQVFASIGIDTPTAIRMFFVKVTDIGGIPFSTVHDEDHYSAEQWRRIDEAYQESLDPKNLIGPFDSVDAMWEYLNHQSV